MADSERQRIMDEIYRRQQIQDLKNEMRRRGVDPDVDKAVRAQSMRSQSGPPRMPGQQPAPTGDDPLVYRGTILPLGKTQSGKVVPAIPEPLYAGARATRDAMQGTPPAVGDVVSGASLGVGPAPGIERPSPPNAIYKSPAKPEVPTSTQIGAAKRAAYEASEAAGVAIKPEAFKGLVQGILDEMQPEGSVGFHKGLHPRGAQLLSALEEEVQRLNTTGTPISLKRLDIMRQLARGVYKKPTDENEGRIASIVIKRIDQFIGSLKDDQVVGGNTAEGVSHLQNARTLAAVEAKSEILDDIFERALDQKGDYRASGIENALRSQFKKLRGSDDFERFSPEEQDAIKDAGRTGGLQHLLITMGKFSPTSGALGMLVGGGAGAEAVFHDPRFAAIPLAGLIAKFAATKMRESAAGAVSELVKGGAPISDYRLQQQLKRKARSRQLERAGLFGGAGLVGPQGDDFNPLQNPNQT